ncbi:MAG: DUF167 domain-containing protein [Parachlamydiales bacterium]|jgi:hypothetical protein
MLIKVKIIPKSKINKIVEFENDILKIKIKAVPEKGKANEELIKFLSEIFSISKKDIKIVSGHHAKIKLIQIDGITIDNVIQTVADQNQKK